MTVTGANNHNRVFTGIDLRKATQKALEQKLTQWKGQPLTSAERESALRLAGLLAKEEIAGKLGGTS
ncbi:MAG: hypothetical protein HQ564_06830 [Candidatus Saganbacteria bacterium]|nr:hypothetical protein [Candidatus Saganbacteria bacterium]